MKYLPQPCVALFAAFILMTHLSAQADNFGTSGNEFTIDFVNIGNAGNAADTTGYGAVPYQYRMGKYEISQDAITKATASGMANVTAGAYTGNQPAANISWYEAAAFVNWLNTSRGHQAAYGLTFSGSWSMTLWSSADAWQAGGENLYRHKDAYYFLPSENEWYKAAYYDPTTTDYYLYATGSNTAPTAVASGTDAGTAVYNGQSGPADVNLSGGLSPYGTMAQHGNVWEWSESASDGSNNVNTEDRAILGGSWNHTEPTLRDSLPVASGTFVPFDSSFISLRVASVPEPSTYALLLLGAGAVYVWKRRKGLSRS